MTDEDDDGREFPFSNGSQFADWAARNCDRCVKHEPDGPAAACEIDAAILDALIDDGGFAPEMAERLGYVEGVAFSTDGGCFLPAYTWDCPERVLNARAVSEGNDR